MPCLVGTAVSFTKLTQRSLMRFRSSKFLIGTSSWWKDLFIYERVRVTRVTRMAYSPSLWMMAIGW